jgi:hypothetical protein
MRETSQNGGFVHLRLIYRLNADQHTKQIREPSKKKGKVQKRRLLASWRHCFRPDKKLKITGKAVWKSKSCFKWGAKTKSELREERLFATIFDRKQTSKSLAFLHNKDGLEKRWRRKLIDYWRIRNHKIKLFVVLCVPALFLIN